MSDNTLLDQWTQKLNPQVVADQIQDPGSVIGEAVITRVGTLTGPTAKVTLKYPQFFAWNWETYGFNATITLRPDGTSVAVVDKRGRDFFDAVSPARTAPTTTLYVNSGTPRTLGGVTFGAGSDSNAGTAAAPFASINECTNNLN